jgi:hypothetical protein
VFHLLVLLVLVVLVEAGPVLHLEWLLLAVQTQAVAVVAPQTLVGQQVAQAALES